MPSTSEASFGARLFRAIKRLVITLLVLGLAGAAAFFMSQLNSRTFTVEVREGKLFVLKGRLLPTGSEPYRPGDPVLADAYAPLDLAGTFATGIAGRRFADRDELDRALFDVVETLARPRVTSEDPKLLEAGLYYLRRAERLSGLTEEQKLSIRSLQAEVAYYQARSKLEDAGRLISESLVQLRLAGAAKNRNAHSANQMILAVEPPAKALEEALRNAVHGLSQPAAQAPPPPAVEPTPAAQVEAPQPPVPASPPAP